MTTPGIMMVRAKQCDQCLFSSAKIVSDARRDEILDYCNVTGEAFECHKATIAGEKITCRGFFDGNHSLVVRLAKMFGWYRFGVERHMATDVPILPQDDSTTWRGGGNLGR